jgi:predicted helicase
VDIASIVDWDTTKFSWDRQQKKDVISGKHYVYDKESIRCGLYRPFFKQHVYFNRTLNNCVYQLYSLFPENNSINRVIVLTGAGAGKPFSVLMTDSLPNYHTIDTDQCFPLYWYDDRDSYIMDLFSQGLDNENDKYVRNDGVSDWILTQCRKQYGYKTPITKEDIFYYVYGILHSPDYRSTFEADLKKMLPRLPLVESKEDFYAFSNAGRKLAELHLNYETIEPYKECEIISGNSNNYLVEKMRFGKKDSKTADKSVIYYNNAITIQKIPLEAYEYVVNGKSAIEWIMERYAVTTDSKSGITNNPNDWAIEHNDEKYILNLLLRVINVSMQTIEIVKSLKHIVEHFCCE